MSKRHLARQFHLPDEPGQVPAPVMAGKPAKRTIAFLVTAEEWAVLESFSQTQYRGLVSPTLLVSDLLRTALREGRFSP